MKLKIIFCIVLLSLFCGCGKKVEEVEETVQHIDHGEIPTEPQEEDSTETTSETTTIEITTQESTEETTLEEEEESETEEETSTQARVTTEASTTAVPLAKKQSGIKADISYKGVDIMLGDNADDVASRLELVATSSNISKSGNSKIYSYDGVNLCATSKKGNVYYINKVEITNANITTVTGMGVGKTAEDLQRVYGDESRRDGSLYRYDTSSDRYMYFIVQDGKVTAWGVALS